MHLKLNFTWFHFVLCVTQILSNGVDIHSRDEKGKAQLTKWTI